LPKDIETAQQPGRDGPAPPAAAFGSLDNAYLLLALTALLWSGNHVIGRAIAGHAPPLGISTARWLFGAIVLWPIARPHLRRDWPQIKRHWRAILFLGASGGALFSALQYVGLQYTTALNVSVMNSLGPVFIAAAGALMFGDRLAPRQRLGIATSLVGVLAIVTRGDPQVFARLTFNWGDLLILFNMGIWGVYVASLRLRPPIHALSFIYLLAVISSLGTLPFFAWEHFSGVTFHATWLTAFAVAYVAIFPGLVGYATWNRGVELIGANRAAAFLHLIPLFSAVLASTFLGEQLMAYHVAGFGLILAGVHLTARRATHGGNRRGSIS
jgi:drug/metabolite transporter (DMT)-like permease